VISTLTGPFAPFGPLEADPPLVVDADAVLAFAVTAQGLQRVAGQGREVLQARSGFQPVEPFFSLSCETGELLDPLAFGKTLGLGVPVAHDHSSKIAIVTLYVKRNEEPAKERTGGLRAAWRLFRRRRRVVALPSTERQFDCLSLPNMRLPPFGARNAPNKPSETGTIVGLVFAQ
jgi:hypothetical protein